MESEISAVDELDTRLFLHPSIKGFKRLEYERDDPSAPKCRSTECKNS
jgi:hypothetical protein